VTAATAYQANKGGGFDAVAFKLNAAGTGLAYGTFLGGSSDDYAQAVALDASNRLHIAGVTASANFPTQFGLAGVARGGSDGFVAVLPPTDAAPNPSAYFGSILGGSGTDLPWAVAVRGGSIYVAGETTSANFLPAGTGGFDTSFGGSTDGFVVKFNPVPASGNATLAYGTYLGGSDIDRCFALAVDAGGAAHMGVAILERRARVVESAGCALGGASGGLQNPGI
jgi:hypothetical protein